MYRDPTYQDPFSTLGIKDLLALGRLSGRRSLQAKWAFLALLPEISEREAYRLEGFKSLSEYAAIKGGIGRDEVGLVLSLHRRIGQFWVLWRLFAMGAVGVSKLQRIARWVTAENAAWWAEQVVKCTRAQLDALIEAMRSQESAAESGPVEMGPKPAPHHGESPRMRPPEVGQSECASQASPGAAARIAAGQGSITPENASEPAREATADAHPWETGLGGPVVLRLHMSPAGAKALQDLLAQVEAAEGPTSLGSLVGRLACDALDRGSAPARADRGASHALGPQPSDTGDAESQLIGTRRPGLALAPKRMLQVVYCNLDTGAKWLPTPFGPVLAANLPASDQAGIAQAPTVRFDELRTRALAAMARHTQKHATSPAAEQDPEPDSGRHIPTAISIYLMARSGGLCERQGCKGQARHFHHCDPYSEHHTHDPDRMLAICKGCHDGYHGGLVVPDKADPRIWWPVKLGEPLERSRVDEAIGDLKGMGFQAG